MLRYPKGVNGAKPQSPLKIYLFIRRCKSVKISQKKSKLRPPKLAFFISNKNPISPTQIASSTQSVHPVQQLLHQLLSKHSISNHNQNG